jgi:hypothetical protein
VGWQSARGNVGERSLESKTIPKQIHPKIMVTLLVVGGSMLLLYGLIVLFEWAIQRWLPPGAIAPHAVTTDNGVVVDGIAYGMTGIALEGPVPGSVVAAFEAEVPIEAAAVGEAIAPVLESAQAVISHGAEAIAHAIGG